MENDIIYSEYEDVNWVMGIVELKKKTPKTVEELENYSECLKMQQRGDLIQERVAKTVKTVTYFPNGPL